jgi:endo-beta-N-acetylglucosaminidase D
MTMLGDVNQSSNLVSVIKVNDIPVINITAYLDTAKNNYQFSYYVINKELLQGNVQEIQDNIDEFKQYTKDKAAELGYIVFI